MISVESRTDIRAKKRELKDQLKEYRIKLVQIADHPDCKYHYNTVKSALDEYSAYWSDEIVALAYAMIDEKKKKDE